MLITIIGMATGKILVGVSSSSIIGNCLNILRVVIGNCLHILHLSNIEDSDILLYMHNMCVCIYIHREKLIHGEDKNSLFMENHSQHAT